MPLSPRSIIVMALAAAAAFLAAAPAKAAVVCGEGTYAYAGFALGSGSRGVSATIEQMGPLNVRAGHVAGWVGVVEPTTGDAWLQVGLSALPNNTTSQIYYEVAAPGHAPVYRDVRRFIAAGEPHRFAVRELDRRPSWWRVWVDGQPVTAPIHLRGSHNRWRAQVLGESWAGTTSGACNAYAYSFSKVSLFDARYRDLAGLDGRALTDPEYTVLRYSRASFLASSITAATAPVRQPAHPRAAKNA